MKFIFYSVLLISLIASCKFNDEAASLLKDYPEPTGYNKLNLAAGGLQIYELQARMANACQLGLGSEEQQSLCAKRLKEFKSPKKEYNHEGPQCDTETLKRLDSINLGTLDDLSEDTQDFQDGITIKYIKEKVGANTIWLMPLFPNNDKWMGDERKKCDDLGSPYAVRDYMHVRGELDRICIEKVGKDGTTWDYSTDNGKKACWGTKSLENFIAKAHDANIKVMLDVAINHFGHNYMFYDYEHIQPVRNIIANNGDLNSLWDYKNSHNEAYLKPRILDSIEKLEALQNDPLISSEFTQFKRLCPNLKDDKLVRGFGMWRIMLDWERDQLDCSKPMYLENWAPGFYLGSTPNIKPAPSKGVGDNFNKEWTDVKFLFHHDVDRHQHEFVRNREYLFRILNYWVSLGVDGFRLDHTTDSDGGMGANEWKYLLGKVDYYSYMRGEGRKATIHPPVYLAEEFGNQEPMRKVVDIMIDGYVFDMRTGASKDTSHIEAALNNSDRHQEKVYVLRALETHDEHRVVERTGWDVWTGAGFWGVGAASRGVPMIWMGQEFGEEHGRGFAMSNRLKKRFDKSTENESRDLTKLYKMMMKARSENSALSSEKRSYIRPRNNQIDQRIFAMMKWDPRNNNNVVFVFHNLWKQGKVSNTFYLNDEQFQSLAMQDQNMYQLINVFDGTRVTECRAGWEFKQHSNQGFPWKFYIELDQETRMQWLRLELCQ